ncbi:MAG: low molecular weight protein arginine phosphatase [Gemmatimonadaceae bacterium]
MRILFVCTGNTCRSALSAEIARRIASEFRMGDIEIGSAGTSAWEGSPASDGALLVGMESEIDLTHHRSRQLTREIVGEYDLILVMGPHHLERTTALGGEGKAFLVTDYASRGASQEAISDPMGSDLEVYRSTCRELEREIRGVFERFRADHGKGEEWGGSEE